MMVTTLKTTDTHNVLGELFRGIRLKLDDNHIRNVIVFLKSFLTLILVNGHPKEGPDFPLSCSLQPQQQRNLTLMELPYIGAIAGRKADDRYTFKSVSHPMLLM